MKRSDSRGKFMTKTRVLTIAALAAAIGIPATIGLSQVVGAATLPSHMTVAAQSQGVQTVAEANENPNAEANEAPGSESAEAGESADASEADEAAGPDTDNAKQGPGSTAERAESNG
jgi:hypothetical protein